MQNNSVESEITQQIFIYSSLRKGFHQDVFKYISRFFTFVSTAKVKGILSNLANVPIANPTNQNSFIKGELYQLTKNDDFSWVFGQLDDYEGLGVEEGEQPLYRREIAKIYKDDGSVTKAWIYWYNADISGMPVIVSKRQFKISNLNRS